MTHHITGATVLTVMADHFEQMSTEATFIVDCSSPVSDKFFELADLTEYLQKKMKVAGLRNNLGGKVVVAANDTEKKVNVTASVKYSKRAIRYYVRKFLKKQNLRDRFRVIAVSKDAYELRPYRVSSDE